jgi:tRNA-2-methylthio-N6-dimethylallyladenosine synthase
MSGQSTTQSAQSTRPGNPDQPQKLATADQSLNPTEQIQPRTYFIQNYGCQMNTADSERIAADYAARGFDPIDDWRQAQQIVINTCAVRKRVEDRVRAFIHKITEEFSSDADKNGQTALQRPKIILTGCMLHHGADKLRRMEPAIDQVMPISQVGFNLEPIRSDDKHAFVPISTGCNSYCSYCIVPYARGREKSRPMSDIMAEIERLAEQGYQEITLLGQNVNSYGLEKVGVNLRKKIMNDDNFSRQDLPSNQSQYLQPTDTPPFVQLLQQISQLPVIKTIRFLSANPWDFHDELIAEIGRNQKIDRYVHLPVQSGSNSVLRRMNRGYTREKYLEIVAKLRQADPNIVLGTDIIVGFPGETVQEFQQTVDLAKQVKWQIAFVAKYSPRPGTAAERLYEDNIPHSLKVRRFHILDKIINRPYLDQRPKIV